MKRVVLIALSVALFAGVANAQPVAPGTASLWLTVPGGGNEIYLEVSETAVFQLWMDYTAPVDSHARLMIGMDALHQMLPTPPVLPEDPNQCIEVVGWTGPGAEDQYGPWGVGGTFFTKSRGILDEAPFDGVPDYTGCGNLDLTYMYIATVFGPYTTATGLLPNGGAMMLDETIIHGNCDTGTTFNKVFFASGAQAPGWNENTFYGGVAPYVTSPKYAFALGTGINKKNAIKVHVTPEPGSLALLAFGGLAAIRRRR